MCRTNAEAPLSPPNSPFFEQQQTIEPFSPIGSDLHDTDSVLLPVDNISPYLDKVLRALGLHTEARTSFITYVSHNHHIKLKSHIIPVRFSYWLPSLWKHKYIALRFLPQASYEQAAPLNISPQPDITIRIFMLFKGVAHDELADWAEAQQRAEEDVVWWRYVVDVDIAKVADVNLFRVLEWGGMEVLRAKPL